MATSLRRTVVQHRTGVWTYLAITAVMIGVWYFGVHEAIRTGEIASHTDAPSSGPQSTYAIWSDVTYSLEKQPVQFILTLLFETGPWVILITLAWALVSCMSVYSWYKRRQLRQINKRQIQRARELESNR